MVVISRKRKEEIPCKYKDPTDNISISFSVPSLLQLQMDYFQIYLLSMCVQPIAAASRALYILTTLSGSPFHNSLVTIKGRNWTTTRYWQCIVHAMGFLAIVVVICHSLQCIVDRGSAYCTSSITDN